MSEILIQRHGMVWLEDTNLNENKLKHSFSTRIGGVSYFPKEDLNLSYRAEENQKNVRTNLIRWTHALGIPWENLVVGEQVHGSQAAVVTMEDFGRGAFTSNEAINGVDALITREKGVPLMAFFADCVPVILFDAKRGVLGLVHAGWKGIVQKNTEKAVRSMESLGARSSSMQVYIGPSIGKNHFMVGPEVQSAFQDAGFAKWIDVIDGDIYIDLQRCMLQSLLSIGVKEENITVSSYDTWEEETLFFSYRREGSQTGRMAAIAMMS